MSPADITQPALTQWQFYAHAITLFVASAAYLYVIWHQGMRDHIDGYNLKKSTEQQLTKIGMVILGVLAIVTFFFLPEFYHAFVDDASQAAAEIVVAPAGSKLEQFELSHEGPVWGWPATQFEYVTIYGIPVSAVLMGALIYIMALMPSPVGAAKKVLKVLMHVAMVVALFGFTRLHYFNAGEILPIVIAAAIAAACWTLSAAAKTDLENPPMWFKRRCGKVSPPPVPRKKTSAPVPPPLS
ncbi:MAG: hypothetical protein IJ632_06945 [Muribaculaceae bacterium]|nr:hypothetical protein [Muribaculaceae bacterium]